MMHEDIGPDISCHKVRDKPPIAEYGPVMTCSYMIYTSLRIQVTNNQILEFLACVTGVGSYLTINYIDTTVVIGF